MNSYVLYNRLGAIHKQIQGLALFARLPELTKAFNYVQSTALHMLSRGDPESRLYKKKLEELKQELREARGNVAPREIFQDIAELERSLDRLKRGVFGRSTKNLHETERVLEDFAVSYEAYLQGPSIAEETHFLKCAAALYAALTALLAGLEAILIQVRPLRFDHAGALSLYMPGEQSVSSFARKLLSMDVLYDELLALFDLRRSQHPLRISRVESGSFWAYLLGYPRIIDLIESMVKGGLNYMHRNFTREGKIEGLPKKIESLDRVLELRKRLLEAGIHSEQMDARLQSSSILIAKQLNELLGGEADVTINKERIRLPDAMRTRYIEQSKRLYLVDGQGKASAGDAAVEQPETADASSSNEPA